jgi:hypothetical protein
LLPQRTDSGAFVTRKFNVYMGLSERTVCPAKTIGLPVKLPDPEVGCLDTLLLIEKVVSTPENAERISTSKTRESEIIRA